MRVQLPACVGVPEIVRSVGNCPPVTPVVLIDVYEDVPSLKVNPVILMVEPEAL